jgi:manganese transport protein
VRGPLPLLGPAFVAAVAYVDPGNFATNITAGSSFGYLLVWVVLAGNLMAMLIQYLSAKLGVVTGRSLSQTLGERIRRQVDPRHRGARRRAWCVRARR